MQETRFIEFLRENDLTENGIKSRVSKGKRIERELNDDLDDLVSSDETMYNSLCRVLSFEDKHNNMQNVLRKYYEFKNGRKFPRKSDC